MIKATDIGKPSGISLIDHTLHVEDEAKYILEKLDFLAKKYHRLTGANLEEELLAAVKYHDWGKAHPQWQNACKADNLFYKKWRVEKGYDPNELNAEQHREFEKDLGSRNIPTTPKLMRSGLRHEFASLQLAKKNSKDLSDVVSVAIAAHHRKLGFGRSEERWKNDGKGKFDKVGPFHSYFKSLKKLNSIGIKKELKESILLRFKFSMIRSLLQLADTRASRKEGEGDQANYEFQKFKLENKYETLRPVQQAAQELGDKPISILRAPTGSGKTYASLIWADRQINEFEKADRLVIAMPTRFTSNALAISVGEQIDETGLYHSSAWFIMYGELTDKETIKNAREAHRMARYLATPISVCTVDHLLICLTGTKEQHHSSFSFLANSAVVFDEVDFYDSFIQANIQILLSVLQLLEVPILIMSATVPNSARELYKIEEPIKIPEPTERKEHKKYLKWIDEESLTTDDILDKMIDKEIGIIYANTIARALHYFDKLKSRCSQNDIPLIIYHSRFTEPGKKDIEGKLINTLGKEAWENNTSIPVRGIAIMTQIGEMSVNISTDIMLSDVCPWDRLAQRIGRLVRFENQDSGICYLAQPLINEKLYPAPYGEFDMGKKEWIANPAFLDTQTQLSTDYLGEKQVSENDLENFVNLLYPSAPEILGKSLTNQINYRSLIKHNWLILPNTFTDEEGGYVGGTEEWSSRHIPPQQTVLIEVLPRFSDFTHFQEHVLQYGVSVPIYQIEKELKKKDNSRIGKMKIFISKNEQEYEIYYTSDYDPNMGLSFLYDL